MATPKLEVVGSSGGKNQIYSSIKHFALEGLNDLIRVLLESVDDALFELSDKVSNDRERNMYFEALREIRLKREGLQQNFDYEMKLNFEQFVKGKNSAQADDEENELTLVELDDLEDNIAIDNMISKARPHFEDDLFAVTERLKLVLRRKQIDADENPLDPKAICDSFHKASDLLETDIQVKLIFYKLFDRYVMSNLGHFYKELNDLFVEKGVLPGFKADHERMKQTTRYMANRIRNKTPDPAAGAVQGLPAGASPGLPGATPMIDGGNLFATLQQAVVGAPGTMAAAQGGGGGVAGTSGVIPGGGGVPGVPGGAVSSGGVPGSSGGAGGFVAALSSLQANSIPSQPVAAIDPQNLRAESHQQLLDFRQQNRHQVNSADSQTIDVVSMLFDFFFDDEALPAPIKVLIGRLQIPILKVAILDKNFFNQKKHPARKLLDSISRAALGWGDSHKDQVALIEKIEAVVNLLINEFQEDIEVFEEAFINFENFLQQEEQATQVAEESLRQQERQKDQQIQQSRDAAAALIGKLTSKHKLSYEVNDFLETTWTSVLFNAHLSLGESSNHWRNLKRISTTFVWTLIPKFTEAERVKIIKTIPALLRALSKGMALVKISTAVQNRIFKILAQEHAKIVKQTSKNIVTRVDDKTVWPVDEEARAQAESFDPDKNPDYEFNKDNLGGIEVFEDEVNDDSITIIDATETSAVIEDLNQFAIGVKQGEIKVDEEIILNSEADDDFDLIADSGNFMEQAQALEIGSWVEFIESPDNTRVARLSWKSNISGKFVFVNRQGHKVRNLSISGFAAELCAGRVKCIESSSVFDRAIHTIMTKMQH